MTQLIAYADRFGGSIEGLHRLLTGPLAGLFDGVHVLPYFTPYDGADAGFDPVDHTAVDPRLGGWDDVRALAGDLAVMTDVIVNHVSADSAEFRDVRERGDASPHARMFLTLSSVFPDGATEEQLSAIFRPRPGLPFTPYDLGGRRRLVWTTFTSQQVDLDLGSDEGQAYLDRVLTTLADAGVRMIRLDAAGYAIKTPGTSCFMTEETFAFIDRLAARARELGMTVLVEIHASHEMQQRIAARVDLVYDFALPPLLLHGLTTGDAEPLRRWLGMRPTNCVTVLDTHDGIGVMDVRGLLDDDQVHALVEAIHENTHGESRKATGWAASNVDVYQINATYWSAAGGDDAYLLARAIQLFLPGLPQVYYVGLLAGADDMELLAATGVGRDINRHRYTDAEIAEALERPVVRRQLELLRLRAQHPAFGGEFTLAGEGPRLELGWRSGESYVRLEADLAARTYRISEASPGR
ncbi:sucrose phosphorylase [Raineyella antarctica]|uniref:Sucrose phosphorylase n=1 Tax=Raineyella antarctica TaxID=1577474 RepID=A0A1G6GIK2_9ACTN|nr:sucrose phosphorylase [Raineyella antarctica]SDB81016.1 sucrose phosphorylase [Raineyella antarctica]